MNAGMEEQGARSKEHGAGSRKQGARSKEQGAGSREQRARSMGLGAGSMRQWISLWFSVSAQCSRRLRREFRVSYNSGIGFHNYKV